MSGVAVAYWMYFNYYDPDGFLIRWHDSLEYEKGDNTTKQLSGGFSVNDIGSFSVRFIFSSYSWQKIFANVTLKVYYYVYYEPTTTTSQSPATTLTTKFTTTTTKHNK